MSAPEPAAEPPDEGAAEVPAQEPGADPPTGRPGMTLPPDGPVVGLPRVAGAPVLGGPGAAAARGAGLVTRGVEGGPAAGATEPGAGECPAARAARPVRASPGRGAPGAGAACGWPPYPSRRARVGARLAPRSTTERADPRDGAAAPCPG